MKQIFFLLFVSLMSSAMAQNSSPSLNDEDQINQTIKVLFDGMRTGDSTMVRSVFHKSARLMTCFLDQNNNQRFAEEEIIDFLIAVGTPHTDIWDERLTLIEIKIDLNFAQVWTEYKFYLNETFLHCGVNAFQLVKEGDSWKIFQLTDTRKTSDC